MLEQIENLVRDFVNLLMSIPVIGPILGGYVGMVFVICVLGGLLIVGLFGFFQNIILAYKMVETFFNPKNSPTGSRIFGGIASILVIIAYFYYFKHQPEILIWAGVWVFLFEIYLDKERDTIRRECHEMYIQQNL